MRRLMTFLAMLVVATTATTSVANAAPRPHLYKTEAAKVAKDAIREAMNTDRTYDWVTNWWMESASKCERISLKAVDCDFFYLDEGDVDDDGTMYGCADTIVIRETRTHYRWRYPYDPECSYGWTW